jgi:hypothetical protein
MRIYTKCPKTSKSYMLQQQIHFLRTLSEFQRRNSCLRLGISSLINVVSLSKKGNFVFLKNYAQSVVIYINMAVNKYTNRRLLWYSSDTTNKRQDSALNKAQSSPSKFISTNLPWSSHNFIRLNIISALETVSLTQQIITELKRNYIKVLTATGFSDFRIYLNVVQLQNDWQKQCRSIHSSVAFRVARAELFWRDTEHEDGSRFYRVLTMVYSYNT